MPEPLPEIRALLRDATAPQLDPSLPVPQLRELCDQGILALHHLVRPADAVVRDFAVPVSGGSVPVRLYRPAGAEGSLQVHVHLHGGGWWMGSIATADPMCRELAERSGLAVLSVGYRLAPEVRWPVPVDDVCLVLEWLAKEGPALGVDGTRPSLGGESAGANLSAAVALRLRDAGDPALAGLWLDVPAVDLSLPPDPSVQEFGSGFGLELGLMQVIRGWYVDPDDITHQEVSPALAADLAGLPPTLLTTAELDPLRDQGERFAAALEAAGVPVVLRRAEGHIHASGWLTGLNEQTARDYERNLEVLTGFHRVAAASR